MRFFLAVLLLLVSGSALACSCSERPVNRAFERSDYVYVGRVMSAAVTSDEVIESQLNVQEVLKGKPDQYVFVSAAKHNAGCEAVVVVGENYIVFGQYGKKPVLHSCSDTKMLQYPEQIEEFRNGS